MSSDPTPSASNDDTPDDDDAPILSYANPRLCRRYQKGTLWMAICRVVGGAAAACFLSGYVAGILSIAGEGMLWIALGVGALGLVGMILWERKLVLKDPIWEGAKDLRAQTWLRSKSRHDSSGVTIVDPHTGASQRDSS